MRYFRRSGPTVILQESQQRNPRLVKGPTDTEPGTLVAYDDTWPDEAGWAEQMAGTPGYYECDANGLPVGSPPPKPTPAAPVAPVNIDLEEQPVSED